MTEIKFSEKEFFIPGQSDIKQRDKEFRDFILEFAIQYRLVSKGAADNWMERIGKLYSITTLKEGKEYTFTVGENNPFNGCLILSILRAEQFYAIINFNTQKRSLDYSMISLTNNSNVEYFRRF